MDRPRFGWIALVLGGFLAGLAPASQEKDGKPADAPAVAKALVEALVKEDFAAAGKDFDEAMKKALPPEKLQEMWKGMTKQLGPFRKQTAVRAETAERNQLVFVTCQFEKLAVDFKVTVTSDRKITGLFIVPVGSAVEYKPPAYVNRDAFRESDVTVGSGEWALPGTLSMPLGDGPFPGVVLVHGSGPNDRDETLLANKPFRDLAWGLASRGVAVLRYEKRTRQHGTKISLAKDPFTVKEEVIDDALAAAALLRQTKGVDGKKVFVLGHSLGAALAPRIARQDPEIAGLLILAGFTRPLEDLYLEQMTYLYSLGGALSEEQKAELEKIKKQAARLKEPGLSPDTPAAELPLGLPAAYWLSLRDYRPHEAAAGLKRPLLILQGERDYQVTMEDFAGWQKALAGRKDVKLKSYPALNHLFMEGKGKAKPAEYQKAGHVAQEVIDDIVGWIKSLP